MEGRGERGRRAGLIAALLALLLAVGLVPAVAQASPFPDVADGVWYSDAVTWAKDNEVMNGYQDGTFGPDDPLLREQAAAVFYNYLGGADRDSVPATKLRDVLQSAWYARPVNWAVGSGTMLGYDNTGTFGVGDPLTREQLAVVMARVCGADLSKVDTSRYDALPDHASTSDWAEASVAWAVQHGVVNGFADADGSRSLAPQATVTRAQMAAIVMNAVKGGVLKKSSGSTKADGSNTGSSGGTYTVRFVSEEAGTTRTISERTYKRGDRITVPANPTRSGYEFRSWNTDDDGSGTVIPTNPTCTGDATWKVVWSPVAPTSYTKGETTLSDIKYSDGVKECLGTPNEDGESMTVSSAAAAGVEVGDLVVTDRNDLENLLALRVESIEVQDGGQVVIRGSIPDVSEVFEDLLIEGAVIIEDAIRVDDDSNTAVEAQASALRPSLMAQTVETQSELPLPKVKLTFDYDSSKKDDEDEKSWNARSWGQAFSNKRWTKRSQDRHKVSGKLKVNGSVEVSMRIEFKCPITDHTVGGPWVLINHSSSKVSVKGTVSGSGKIHLGYYSAFPLALDVDVALSASGGSVSFTAEHEGSYGFDSSTEDFWVNKDGKWDPSFTPSAKLTAKAGLSEAVLVGLGNMELLSTTLEDGLQLSAEPTIRSTDLTCIDAKENLYLEMTLDGAKPFTWLLERLKVKMSFTFFDDKNSPVAAEQHFEIGSDGIRKMDKCSWEAYTVSFDANEGTGEMADQVIHRGDTVALSSNAFNREGYSFAGWSTSADGTGTKYRNGARVKDLAEAQGKVTLYARWSKKADEGDSGETGKDDPVPTRYLIVYNANGGSGLSAGQSAKSGEDVTLEACPYTREGYSFAGWSADVDGGGTRYADGATVRDLAQVGGMVTLYAQWVEEAKPGDDKPSGEVPADSYGILFLPNYDMAEESEDPSYGWQVATVGEDVELAESPFERKGLWVKSWTTEPDGSGTSYKPGATVRDLAASGGVVTLYAQWADSVPLSQAWATLYDDGELVFSAEAPTEEELAEDGREVTDSGTWGGITDGTSYYTSYIWRKCRNSARIITSQCRIKVDKSLNAMFSNWDKLEDVSGLRLWDTSSVKLMTQLFNGCKGLSDISPISSWDTSSVRGMYATFAGCTALSDVSALSSWDISSSGDMSALFKGCTSLSDLSPIAGWDTSSVTDMSALFEGCTSLSDLSPIAGWDTSSVTNMAALFKGCTSLVKLNSLSDWNTASVVRMGDNMFGNGMFQGCTSLSELSGISAWDTSSVTDMTRMFSWCTSLSELSPISLWDTSSMREMADMFSYCTAVSDFSPLSSWSVSSAFKADMFYGTNAVMYPSWYTKQK